MPDIAVVSCESYESSVCRAALEAVLAPLGGLDWVTPGMKIAIKANLVIGMKPERAATTHPVLLAELSRMLIGRGASVVIGDSPGGLYNAAYVGGIYHAAGLALAEQAGAVLNRDFSQAEASYPEAAVARTFQYTRYLDDADVIIDFCKLKTHGMMAMSAAAKNFFGTIPGTMKPEYHYKYPDPRDFARMLVDLAEYWKPRLTIVDAVVGMDGNGPTAGQPRPIGALLAGHSPHRVDLACAALIGLSRQEVPTLEAAYERGLIPADWQELSISGDLMALAPKEFHNVGAKNGIQFQNTLPGFLGIVESKSLRLLLGSKPKVDAGQCVGCRKCESVCPAHAITMKDGKPKIDRSACIRCFCCQEFCSKGAMKVQRTALARLLNR